MIEAMKMENVMRASHDVVVHHIPTRVGASLTVDQVIMEFELAMTRSIRNNWPEQIGRQTARALPGNNPG